MTKDEYIKTLQKWEDVKEDNAYGSGYSDALQEAITLARQLDEPKKVVIPKFIADWIREVAQPSNLATISVMHSDAIRYGKHIDWFKNHDNQRLLLKALLYGYEVEKEPKYYVQIKGFDDFIDLKYVNYRTSDNTFGLDSKLESSNIKAAFTKSWLKDNWLEYDVYNNAGLLEFEEVEDE